MSASVGPGEILIIKQVAEYLKVTERTIYRLAAAKKIPAFKVGGTWRFSRADIERWINQQSVSVKPDEPIEGERAKKLQKTTSRRGEAR
jgi:excisionase family DNA binding protein